LQRLQWCASWRYLCGYGSETCKNGFNGERELIKTLRPEIIKVENRDALTEIRNAVNGTPIIAERIETARHAELARKLGAMEIQGFWCDRQAPANAGHRMPANVYPSGLVPGIS
jgi:hypothetical protein